MNKKEIYQEISFFYSGSMYKSISKTYTLVNEPVLSLDSDSESESESDSDVEDLESSGSNSDVEQEKENVNL
jgi:hypothetical protein